MILSTPSGYSLSDLVFQEDFSGTTIDSTWHNYMTSNTAKGSPWTTAFVPGLATIRCYRLHEIARDLGALI